MRLPDLGYSDVTHSKVMALLMSSKHAKTQIGMCDVPTAPAEDEAQSSKPIHVRERSAIRKLHDPD